MTSRIEHLPQELLAHVLAYAGRQDQTSTVSKTFRDAAIESYAWRFDDIVGVPSSFLGRLARNYENVTRKEVKYRLIREAGMRILSRNQPFMSYYPEWLKAVGISYDPDAIPVDIEGSGIPEGPPNSLNRISCSEMNHLYRTLERRRDARLIEFARALICLNPRIEQEIKAILQIPEDIEKARRLRDWFRQHEEFLHIPKIDAYPFEVLKLARHLAPEGFWHILDRTIEWRDITLLVETIKNPHPESEPEIILEHILMKALDGRQTDAGRDFFEELLKYPPFLMMPRSAIYRVCHERNEEHFNEEEFKLLARFPNAPPLSILAMHQLENWEIFDKYFNVDDCSALHDRELYHLSDRLIVRGSWNLLCRIAWYYPRIISVFFNPPR